MYTISPEALQLLWHNFMKQTFQNVITSEYILLGQNGGNPHACYRTLIGLHVTKKK